MIDGDERLLTVDYDDVWQTVVAEIDDWLPCEDLEVSFRPSSMDGSEVPELSFQLESLLPLDDITVHAEIDEINVPGVIGFTIENQTCAKHYEVRLKKRILLHSRQYRANKRDIYTRRSCCITSDRNQLKQLNPTLRGALNFPGFFTPNQSYVKKSGQNCL